MNSCSAGNNDSIEPTVLAAITPAAAVVTTTTCASLNLMPAAQIATNTDRLVVVGNGNGNGNGIRNGNGINSGAAVIGDEYQHTMNNEQLYMSSTVSGVGVSGGIGNLPVNSQERYVWEMRTRSPNVTPASTVLNSPDLNTDMQYTIHPHHHHHHHQRHQQHQIRVGHSPGSQFEQNDLLPQGLASPGSPTDVGKADGQCLRDGEIVVFDDIDTSWMNKTIRNGTPATLPTVLVNKSNDFQSGSSPARHYTNVHTNAAVKSTASYQSNEDVLKVTKMIGQLPIAEYEGSPRRFGNAAVSAAAAAAATAVNSSINSKANNTINYPKRPPGFPQRVSPLTSPHEQQPQQQHEQLQQCQSSAKTNNNNNLGSNTHKSIGNLIDLVDHDDDKSYDAAFRQAATLMTGKTPTFDYLYEFSETRKVLEEFFKANPDDEKRFTDFTESGDDVASSDTQQDYVRSYEDDKHIDQAYIGQRLARIPKDELYMVHRSPKKPANNDNTALYNEHNDIELYIDSNSRSSGDLADTELEANLRRHSRNFTLSPETTDYDSNCGDLDSLSNDINCTTDYGKLYTSMPVLEDGLSSGHASDTENNISAVCDKTQQQRANQEYNNTTKANQQQKHTQTQTQSQQKQKMQQQHQQQLYAESDFNVSLTVSEGPANDLISNLVDVKEATKAAQVSPTQQLQINANANDNENENENENDNDNDNDNDNCNQVANSSHYDAVYAANAAIANGAASKQSPPPPPAPAPHRSMQRSKQTPPPTSTTERPQQRICESVEVQEAMKEIRSALQRAKTQPEKLKFCDEVLPPGPDSPVWVPRKNASSVTAHMSNNHTQQQRLGNCNSSGNNSVIGVGPTAVAGAGAGGSIGDDEEPDTDLETDRLLGQQRFDDHEFFDDKSAWSKPARLGASASADASEQSLTAATDLSILSNNNNSSSGASGNGSINNNSNSNNGSGGSVSNCNVIKPQTYSSATIRQGIGTSLTPNSPDVCQIVGSADVSLTSPDKLQYAKSPTGSIKSLKDADNSDKKIKTRNKEGLLDPKVLIEGVLFRARYLGSTQLVCEGQPTKSTRMMQAEEAVSRIKAPEGESQPSTEVDLFISTEKIMVLNTDLKEIMMDHALRTISYIADIGDLVVLMARRRFVPNSASSCNTTAAATASVSTTTEAPSTATLAATDAACNSDTEINGADSNKDYKDSTANDNGSSTAAGNSAVTTASKHNRTPKMICHVFESDEAQFIAQSIGQAFQVAYMEFLKANGIENENLAKEMDYQEVLNSQEIFGDELEIFAKKELQKEVVVPKAKGEILGVVIVESGWGSMLPTVVIANLMSGGAAARCGQLNIGDQLIAINGMSLVGLPLSTCQSYIRNAKNQTAVKFTVVPCPPVVEVKILRPKALFQLGFSVQNGVICSLLRGGIAERGGVRVGHRIIEINNQSVVAVPHDTIVKLLSSSVGEILMKTMPTSMFRLLTGQETPIYI